MTIQHTTRVSAGSVIDESALIEAGVIAGAGLDFAHKPHVPERLRSMAGVVPTPHRRRHG